MPETPRPALPSSLLGETLAGKYLVEGVLGDGGMGTVVVARHLELETQVAIKLLRDELAGNELVVARFLREGKIAARIRSSEHIVKVRDIGRLESGVPFMVMELLQGEDLETRLDREQRLPCALAVDLALQACDALAAAHEAGIVHRDIKPGNIFLTNRRSGQPSVKVLDFGISKIEGDLAETGHRTSAQDIFGSPFYMSPEQLLSSAEVDSRADIWSLGVVLYEMLVGTLPFEADVLAKLHVAVLQGNPIDIRTHGVDIPDDLARVVHGCLRRGRDERFQNIRDLAEALGPFASPLGLETLEGLRNQEPQSPASISAEWAAYTGGRSLTPPKVQAIPAARVSQRSIPTYHSESKLGAVREVPPAPVSGKTLTPWAHAPEEKLARRKQVGIATAIAALVVLGGSVAFLMRGPRTVAPASTTAAAAPLPSFAPPAPVASAEATPADDPNAAHFEILELQVDAGAGAARSETSRHRKKNDPTPSDKPAASTPAPEPKPTPTKLPDDRN